MTTVYLILLILAAACFGLAVLTTYRPVTTNAGTVRPVPNLVALGLLLWVLVPLIQTARRL